MIRRTLSIVLAFALLLVMIPSASAFYPAGWSPFQGAEIIGDGRLYAQPSAGAKVVATLNYGENCRIVDRRDGWYRVVSIGGYNLKSGWIAQPNIHPDEEAPYHLGVVVSETASLRETANTSAKRVANIKNGEAFCLLDEQAGWYYTAYWDGKASEPLYGWVRVDFVLRDPWYITTYQSTYAYSMPDRNSKKVGQLVAATQLPVIGEMGNFWVVNLRSAAAFIYKGDL